MVATYHKSIRTVFGFKTSNATNKACLSLSDVGNYLPKLTYHPSINSNAELSPEKLAFCHVTTQEGVSYLLGIKSDTTSNHFRSTILPIELSI
jgi:hypothetical protein